MLTWKRIAAPFIFRQIGLLIDCLPWSQLLMRGTELEHCTQKWLETSRASVVMTSHASIWAKYPPQPVMELEGADEGRSGGLVGVRDQFLDNLP